MTVKQQVLVFPRSIFQNVFSLLNWDDAQVHINRVEASFAWRDRDDAEQSTNWIQAIPCAIIQDSEDRWCVLRRVKDSRDDLSSKLSLIVGGHIDDVSRNVSFREVLHAALLREIEEEVGILPSEKPRPIGIIIDESSKQASRHAAFVHEMKADGIFLKAHEEFSNRSKFTGTFMERGELAERLNGFDPWSRILIEDYLCKEDLPPPARQSSFL